MPARAYNDLVDEIPNAHLVVGTVNQLADLPRSARLIERLLVALDSRKDYAVAEMQDGLAFAVHVVFALKTDADQLAAAVQAKPVGRYAGWSSQRAFR